MDEMPKDGFRDRPLWLAAVAGLVLAQAGLALAAFGSERSLAGIRDDRPLLSGRHPLHLYHGSLGAANFHQWGATTCYDPWFQAGYPKTPVFDGGCRPAELFLILAGGSYSPAAYKTGLFFCLLLFPLAFVLAGRGVGLSAGASALAGAMSLILGWSAPVRQIIEKGEFDFLVAGLAVLVFTAWLVRYSRWYGVDSWLVLAGASVVGWYAHPIVWLGLAPLFIGYYLVLAPRRELAWHLGLLGILAAGLAPNLWWLADWARYWWLRVPIPAIQAPVPAWQSVLGSPRDYYSLASSVPVGVVLVLGGLGGLAGFWRSGNRGAAAVLIATLGIVIALARLLATWPRAPLDAPERLAPLAAALLILPAASAGWRLLEKGRCTAFGAAAAIALLLAAAWFDGPERQLRHSLGLRNEPLALGFQSDQDELIAALRDHTTPEARILWDETTDHRPGWNWTALLPLLTGRAYLGGLDHEAGMEYSFCQLRDGKLNGRDLEDWSDAELVRYCQWYNVGWVVCRSTSAADRWGKLPMARLVARLQEGGQSVAIFTLDRPRSFVLKGSATWEGAGINRITFSDMVPDAEGSVTLSFHQQDGLRVYPTYIRIDPRGSEDTADPLRLVRLQVPGPVPRVTLVWENP